MTNETITFFCPMCGIKLTVPASLAGIEGPCPSCGSQIKAPNPCDAVTQEAVEPKITKEPAPLKPKPRHLPQRSAEIEVPARQMPEPQPLRKSRRRAPDVPLTQDPYVRNLIRLMALGFFLLVSAAFMYGVLNFVKRPPPMNPTHRIVEPFSNHNPINEQAPADGSNDADATDLPAESSSDKAHAPNEEMEPNTKTWREAEAVLEKFLSANSLAERLPLIETQTSVAELAASCLAQALAAAKKISPVTRDTHPIEKITDHYYRVEFQSTDVSGRQQIMLIRSRGSSPPKVVVDPFLDTYGGRLAAYAAAPTEKGGVFQVVVYAVASCTDPNIPNREKKLTLKLLASHDHEEIARAYFGRQSKIAEMLEDDTYSLTYGVAKACTVMLRWNTEDNSEYPYLEALTIKDLGWNP